MVRVEGLDLRRGAGHLGLKRATGTFLSALGFEPKLAKKYATPPVGALLIWSEWRGSNPRPDGPKPPALPTALHPDMIYDTHNMRWTKAKNIIH